jgi:hypothetical protein
VSSRCDVRQRKLVEQEARRKEKEDALRAFQVSSSLPYLLTGRRRIEKGKREFRNDTGALGVSEVKNSLTDRGKVLSSLRIR